MAYQVGGRGGGGYPVQKTEHKMTKPGSGCADVVSTAATVTAVASGVGLLIIGMMLINAYWSAQAIHLTGPIDPAMLAKWAMAAQWTGVAVCTSIAILVMAKGCEKCAENRKQHDYEWLG